MADLDVAVAGAGFAGIYAVHAFRSAGLTVRAFEAGSGIGGTWFWNRYPGARCDVESKDYSYSFSPELEQDWSWSERYPAQPEVLRYLNHVADRFGLWPDIQLNTRVTAASWDTDQAEWTVTTDDGASVTARFFVSAVGCLSAYQVPSLPGLETFAGPWYHTSRWPAGGVDFTRLRVGLIGTGSTGIQVAPEIAAVAEHLYVFQRTANFAVPNRNGATDPAWEAGFKADYRSYRKQAQKSFLGVPIAGTGRPALAEPPAEVQRTLTERWQAGGGMPFLGAYTDVLVDRDANDIVAEFMRDRIRETVADPAVAELLLPRTYPVGAKRLCQSDDYFAMFNRPNVTLVDIRSAPLTSVLARGLRTADAFYELDALVFATGFDAISGALNQIDVRGVGGVPLAEKWSAGPRAYLGVAPAGFPNMFIVTGPGSPSVFSNMVLSIEQHVEWIRDCVLYAGAHGYAAVQAKPSAEDAWMAHVTEVAYSTLFPLADSWYVGANIPGKPRVFTSYLGGVGPYRARCDAVAAAGYEGFALDRRLAMSSSVHPQAQLILDGMAAAGGPPIWEMTPEQARAMVTANNEHIGPGPDVASVRDVVIPGQAGGIPARVYSPAPGAPGVVVYYHGGGWVVGSVDGWDASVRALAVASGCDVVSVDYRLAPEHVFPAAADDAYDALEWAAGELADGRPVAVAGDSAGGNLAAVTALRARDLDGPALALQLLVYPVTDCDLDRTSYHEYDGAEFIVNRRDMAWYWDHYVPEPAARMNPYASPLRAPDMSGLPPLYLVTAEHDPLRDEGFAYADRMRAARVPVEHRHYGSQIHGFFSFVNLLDDADKAISEAGATIRAVAKG
ncbi:MAG: alpha/beta hydrolase fold domain-containing protein [Trebonia sp.]|uniref:flavin-containing monooxygenase n=1 Tax=Trebonia sp. TaxID=2767075 RepID=UPI003BAEB885